MIYQRFGKWWGAFSLVDLEVVNFLTLVTEFAAIALAVSHMGVSPYLGVPLAAVGLIAMVITGSYLRWERIAVFLCLLDLGWIVMALELRPALRRADARHACAWCPGGWPDRESDVSGHRDRRNHHRALAVVLPAELHCRQELRFADLKWARLDTFIGAVFTITVAAA